MSIYELPYFSTGLSQDKLNKIEELLLPYFEGGEKAGDPVTVLKLSYSINVKKSDVIFLIDAKSEYQAREFVKKFLNIK